MRRMLLKKNFLFLFLLSLNGCAISPPDLPLCYEIDLSRGYCTHMVSGKSYEVNDKIKLNGKTWWELRPTNIALPAESWKELKAYIIKSCAQYKNCDKEISNWQKTLNNFNEGVKK